MPVKSANFRYFAMISLLWSQNINDFSQKSVWRTKINENPEAKNVKTEILCAVRSESGVRN